jgi:hypothetical protein
VYHQFDRWWHLLIVLIIKVNECDARMPLRLFATGGQQQVKRRLAKDLYCCEASQAELADLRDWGIIQDYRHLESDD